MTLLDITDLDVVYDAPGSSERIPAVEDASLSVERGELVALVGESGSGKSTLGRSLVGLHTPGEILGGSIRLEGTELVDADETTLQSVRGRRIGVAFQDPTTAFDPVYTVGNQIVEALEAAENDRSSLLDAAPLIGSGTDREQRREAAAELLDNVGIDQVTTALDSYPTELSGGQCQRALLASALAGDPELLVADEPTAGLDATTRARVIALLERLARERDLSVLLITHDLGVVAEHCDRVVVLKHGRVVEEGPTERIVTSPEQPATRTLVEAAQTLAFDGSSLRASAPIADGTGVSRSPVERTALEAADTTGLIELDRVGKTYPVDDSWVASLRGTRRTHTAVDDVSLAVQSGETLGIVGESGGGKSTLVELIAGLETPTTGSVRIDGRSVGSIDDRPAELLSRVGVVFQQPFSSLDPRWRIGRSITEPLARLGWPESRRSSRLDELLSLVDLPPGIADARPTALSGGQVQRAALARAVAAEPQVLLLDEPVSALDATTRSRVLSMIADLGANRVEGTVFVSHDIGAIARIADRIGVLRDGELVELGRASDVLEDPVHPYTRELLGSVPELPTATGDCDSPTSR